MKKDGIVGLAIIIIWIIVLYISVSKAISSFDTSSISSMLPLTYPIIALSLGYYILNNMEHFAASIILFVVSAAVTLVMLIFNITEEPTEDFIKIYNLSTNINIGVIIVMCPFLVRTQSKIHRAFKYINVLLLIVTAAMLLSILNNSTKVETLKDAEAIITMAKVTLYIGIAAIGFTAANPIIGYTTADGLGGSVKLSKTPKMVPVNPATDPTMAQPTTINTGINYGDNPVPAGVVASPNPTAEQPPVEVISPSKPEESAKQALNASEVAPELQFLINDDKSQE